jgi:hypothetical protein
MVSLASGFIERQKKHNQLMREKNSLICKRNRSDQFKAIIYDSLITKVEKRIEVIIQEMSYFYMFLV